MCFHTGRKRGSARSSFMIQTQPNKDGNLPISTDLRLWSLERRASEPVLHAAS